MKHVWLYYTVDTEWTYPVVFSSEKKVREYLNKQLDTFEKQGCIVINYGEDLWSVEDLENMRTDHIGVGKFLVL